MKRIIVTIPMQAQENLHRNKYNAMNNEALQSDYETFFPFFAALDNCAEKGEKVAVTAILVDHDNARKNFDGFKGELVSFSSERGIETEMTIINAPYDESVDSHLDLFCGVIDSISEGDELIADITYGSKPMPMIISMALRYAKLNITGTDIKSIIYGRYDFVNHKAYIHDVSALFYMNSVVERLGMVKSENPREIIRSMLML